MRLIRDCGTLAAVVTIAGCGGGGGGGNPPPPSEPTPFIVTRTFPAGDAVGNGGTAWDIVGVETKLFGQFQNAGGNAYDTLSVTVTFAQDVTNALPAPGTSLTSPSNLGIAVAFDTDANPATGNIVGCVPGSTPNEYASDPGGDPQRLPNGNYAISGPGGLIPPDLPTEALTAVSGHTITQTFNLGLFGIAAGSQVPKIGIEVAAFNGGSQQYTDCVPKDGTEIFTNGT